MYTKYNVGRYIIEHEQEGKYKAAYGKQVLKQLSEKLTNRYGKGWSVETLTTTRKFYQTYSNSVNTVYEIPAEANKSEASKIVKDACKARYALLKSIALDKNYIDVTNDSLTSIAVAYYKKHGTVEEKLKSYLYNGRVYVNSKNYEKAMDNYLCAEEYAGKCGDHIIVGRLYSVKSALYNTIFDFKQAINQAHLASEYFLKGGDTTRYLNNLTNVAVIIYNSGSYDSAAPFNKPVDGRI